MEKEYCLGWHLVYDALRDYYYSFGESVQKEFNHFYDPLHFFAPDSLTVGIPLSVGVCVSTGKCHVVMARHIYEQLADFIHQKIPQVPEFQLESLTPAEYEIIDRFEAFTPNILSKGHQRAKKKTKQLTRIRQAHEEAALAKRLVNSSNYVFVSIDIEAYEKDHSILLEIGWSMYDASTNTCMDQHYINDQYRHLLNGQFVEDQKERFNYGTSVWCSLKQALIELRKDLDWAVKRDGGFVLVGHGLDSDLKYLAEQNFLWPGRHGGDVASIEDSAKVTILNTDTIYGASINDLHNPPSLGRTLALFHIDTWNLHNAGNDAHYTLLLLLKLVHDNCDI
ncbi:hypothetical protein HMPREF1544_06401 [Mucor circinelloides 1006PhL]|uniref:Gfd2/YDR514C-like C-terminal domain-containing protein n=1 Tax=Mucor circinelloides f. circinelloides (strain 1006PhL) TaxID=1220926 RepID=S2K3J6_MUCC1|nr:hypothetical protein HMPREF1544_06401 [Mucor circinelloides 1006PhL]